MKSTKLDKVIDVITDISLLILAFTAGVVIMYQVSIHSHALSSVTVLNPTSDIVGVALRAAEITEGTEDQEKPASVEEMITEEAEASGVDPDMALAISRLETGHFTSDAYIYGNNVGGLSDNEIPRSYETLEEGVTEFIECLEGYYSIGLTTPEEIADKYCPVNSDWATVVNELSMN